MTGALYRVGGACARHPWRVIAVWLAAIVTLAGLAAAMGGAYRDDDTAPGSSSARADAQTDRRVGSGRVMWGKSLADVLTEGGAPADLELSPPDLQLTRDRDQSPPDLGRSPHDTPIRWTHRRGPGWDLYFLSNQANTPLKITATFRLSGRRPELWHADSGEMEKLAKGQEDSVMGSILRIFK